VKENRRNRQLEDFFDSGKLYKMSLNQKSKRRVQDRPTDKKKGRGRRVEGGKNENKAEVRRAATVPPLVLLSADEGLS